MSANSGRPRCGSSAATPRTMPPMVHSSSKPAAISQRGAKVCSRSTQFTAMSEIPCRSHLRREAMTPMGCRYPRSCRRRSRRRFGVNGLGDKTLQVMWAGAKYAVTENLDVIAAYYHYIQNSFFGTPTGGPAPCSGREHPQCAGTFDAISAAIDWRFAPKWDLYFGFMFSQVNGGLANSFLQRNNIDPTVGLRFRF